MKKLMYTTLMFFVLGFTGCSLDETVSPQPEQQKTVTILKSADTSLNKMLSAQKPIKSSGGFIVLGGRYNGYSWINFPEGALDNDQMISFSWESKSLMEAEFGPHGLQFNQPVRLHLSYKRADLTGIDESKLGIYYYNEDIDEYELIPSSKVNTEENYVECNLYHFSRYAIGTE